MQTQPSRSPQKGALKLGLPIEERLADEARFFKSWLDNPTIAGAVSPSGRYLARMMARYVDPLSTGPIVELGPGTGAITEALLRRGVARERLCLVEYDPGFCKLLGRRFPGVLIVRGDAYNLVESLRPVLDVPAAAIVSSLPLLMKPEPARLALLAEAFDLLAPDGCFIQFTYGPLSPMPRDKRAGPAFHAEVSPPVWLNLPPARVWVYRRRSSDDEVTQDRPMWPAQDLLAKLRLGRDRFQHDLKKEIDDAKARLGLGRNPRRLANSSSDLDPARRILRHLPDFGKPRRPQ